MPRPGRSSDGADPTRWVALDAAPDQLTAELWLALLKEQGIPAMLNPGDVSSFMGVSPGPVRVMIPAMFEAAARQALDVSDGPDQEFELTNGQSLETR